MEELKAKSQQTPVKTLREGGGELTGGTACHSDPAVAGEESLIRVSGSEDDKRTARDVSLRST
jgi:hypothetical protein